MDKANEIADSKVIKDITNTVLPGIDKVLGTHITDPIKGAVDDIQGGIRKVTKTVHDVEGVVSKPSLSGVIGLAQDMTGNEKQLGDMLGNLPLVGQDIKTAMALR